MGGYKPLTPSTRHFSGSLWGQPDGGAHVRAAGRSGRGQPEIALSVGTTILYKLSPTRLRFQLLLLYMLKKFPWSQGGCIFTPKNGTWNWRLLLQCHSGVCLCTVEQNVPKHPPSPDFITHCKQLCVCKQCRASQSIVLSKRMQLGPCEIGVYLPACGHPGFIAVIQ